MRPIDVALVLALVSSPFVVREAIFVWRVSLDRWRFGRAFTAKPVALRAAWCSADVARLRAHIRSGGCR